MDLLTPKRNYYLNSLCSIAAESNRKKNYKNLGNNLQLKKPLIVKQIVLVKEHHRKFIENSSENMHFGVRV